MCFHLRLNCNKRQVFFSQDVFDDSDLPYDKIGTTHRRSMSNSVHSDAMARVLDESFINMNLTGSLNQHTVIERLIHKYASSV
jgi:hypothetical protein